MAASSAAEAPGLRKTRTRRKEAPAMQTNVGTALLTLALWALCSPGLSTEGKRKLQIGVKKRVDNCPIKSRKGDVLHMHYTGKLEDGTEFDSSLTRDQPFVFSLGTGQVIKGWEQGLLGMCEGEKRKLVIPSELGYGDRGAPPKIPGGATLIFEVELLKIERRQEL
ncbi:peptidyl-prolyl cis-trans isomerase FKBP2 isoform X1 [Erythrolamprus reginae]|uniref:peptidyl-prolyl cis-trans isomerase FKBP2 isoform X1 n=2 Tax=Erythrolamprus reginae TaxID=121349 RepID=UPI00396C3D19